MYEQCPLFTLHTIDTRRYKLKTVTKNLIHLFLLWHENKKRRTNVLLESSGGRDRTSGLWVMSPTSYHCSTPRCCS